MTSERNPWEDLDVALAMRQLITLYPQKFGMVGTYAREMLQAEWSQDSYSWMFDQVLLRVTTSVMCGQTVTAAPVVELNQPASWWQHLKLAFEEWVHWKDELHHGRDEAGEQTTPPPWLVLLWPLLVLFPKWIKRHPVKFTKVSGTVQFEQRVLYPEFDHVPSEFGRPVLYETIDFRHGLQAPPFGGGLASAPSRFLSKHEVISEFMRSSDDSYDGRYGPHPMQFLTWLESRGVNIDQMVKRR